MGVGDNTSKNNKRIAVINNLRLFATTEDQLTSDDYYTPPEFFQDLDMTFDLDVASPVG